MKYVPLAILCVALLTAANCVGSGSQYVRVDPNTGGLLDANGQPIKGPDGQPMKVPQGTPLLGEWGILLTGLTVVGMRLLGTAGSKLPPPWGIILTGIFGGSGFAKTAEPPKT